MKKEKGLLFIISGFSGAGKGTITRRFIDEHEDVKLSISNTTRPPRPGEVDGVHYNFITKEAFEELISAGGLIEYTCYQDNYYGTPKQFVYDNMELGNDVILEIEVDGCHKVKKIFPEAVTIFVVPPSARELEERLKTRGTDTDEKIRKRLKRAVEEAEFVEDYDYLLLNDDLSDAIGELEGIMACEHMRPGRKKKFIEGFERDLVCITNS